MFEVIHKSITSRNKETARILFQLTRLEFKDFELGLVLNIRARLDPSRGVGPIYPDPTRSKIKKNDFIYITL